MPVGGLSKTQRVVAEERIAMEEQTPVTGAQTTELIKFQTLRFGEVCVPTERVIDFPRGLVGIPDASQFVFLHQEEAEGPFFWLQSVNDPALAFVVCEPQIFFPDYRVSLSSEEQDALRIEQEEDGLVCVILVVPEDPRQITANLQGPLVINTIERLGFQFVLASEEYSTKVPIFNNPQEGGLSCSS